MDEVIHDESDLRKYRTEIPNLIDDMGLDVYEARLYLHYKRVCGAKGGTCWQSVRTTAKACKMSKGKVTGTRKGLERKGLIRCEKNTETSTINITIMDIWPANFWWYSAPREGPLPTIAEMVARCPPHGQGAHHTGQGCPPGGRKKEPYKKKPYKKYSRSRQNSSLPTQDDFRAELAAMKREVW